MLLLGTRVRLTINASSLCPGRAKAGGGEGKGRKYSRELFRLPRSLQEVIFLLLLQTHASQLAGSSN